VNTGARREEVTIIEARSRAGAFGLVDTWRRRDLVFFLVLRDLKLRYRPAALGALWAIVQPLFTMAIFAIVFGRVAGISSDGLPYPVWSYVALVPWVYFASSLTRATTSVVGNVGMVGKVYFPRLVLPLAAVLSGLVDFLVASLLLAVMLAWYGIVPGPALLAWPLYAAFAVEVSLGCGLWLAALNARYRDVQHLLPFAVQAWLFVTPIAYPPSTLPEPWRTFLGLNPMAGVVDGLRWSLLSADASTGMIVLSVAVSLVILASGLVYFDRVQSDFADFV
jgi:lipopolysaccharide transport system permease protein